MPMPRLMYEPLGMSWAKRRAMASRSHPCTVSTCSWVADSGSNQFGFVGGVWHFHHPVNKDARGHHHFRIQFARSGNRCGLHNAGPRGHGHQRGEVPGGLVVRHVAVFIGLHPLIKAKSAVSPCSSTYVRPSITGSLPSAERRPHGGWGVERRDAGAASANTLGQRALGHQLEFSDPFAVQLRERRSSWRSWGTSRSSS